MKLVAIFAAATAVSVTNADEYFTGDGTAYTLGQTSAGNCNMMSALDFATTDYAALNDKQWDGLQNCGRCAEVSCADDRCSDQSTSVVVQILDRCPECQHGDLDLSPSVFTNLTGSTPSRYTVSWKFVDCPVQGNVNYCLKGGSNNFWTAVQPTNFATGVQSLQINGQETTMLGSAYYYLLDGASEAQTDLTSVTISMTDVNGNSIEDTVSLTADSCTEGANQFPSGGSTSQTSQQTYQQTTPTTTSPAPTQTPTQTPTPTSPAPTQTPTQTPTPTTVRPASPATTAPSSEQGILPTTVPVSTTATPTTAPPSTTSPPTTAPSTTSPSTIPPSTIAPSTTAPVTTIPESSTTQESATSSGSTVNQFDQQLFNVTGTVEPESTTSPTKTPKTAGSSTDEEESTQQTQQQPAATTVAPTSTTEQTADSQAAGDDAQTVTTESGQTSNDTDPLIIGLSTLGAVGVVALIVAVVMAKRKSIQQEKARDMEAPSMSSMQSFDVHNTPAERRQAFGIL
jgi:expansin (peptidoglycan-binding protein)